MKSSDVEAAVESLRVTEAQWYGELTAERRAGLWRELFHGQKSGAGLPQTALTDKEHNELFIRGQRRLL